MPEAVKVLKKDDPFRFFQRENGQVYFTAHNAKGKIIVVSAMYDTLGQAEQEMCQVCRSLAEIVIKKAE